MLSGVNGINKFFIFIGYLKVVRFFFSLGLEFEVGFLRFFFSGDYSIK